MKSTIAAFLMSIPLSAIGLMAVFGIPQMAPGSLLQKGFGQGAGQDEDVLRSDYFEDEEESPANRRRRSRSLSRSESESAAPAFDGADEADVRDASPPRSGRASAWDQHAEQTDEQSGGTNPFASRNRSKAAPGREAPIETADAGSAVRERITNPRTNLTWKSARNRLTELGVTHFHLERGSNDDSFLFVCMFSPGDDPRVTRRFEAEAPEPLAAVDGVLGQIDTWMQRRFASQSAVGFNR